MAELTALMLTLAPVATLAMAKLASYATPCMPTPLRLAATMPARWVPCPLVSLIPVPVKSMVYLILPARSG